MDPIEIFELYGYVVEASSVNAELAVNATELRGYVIQQARARNVLFTSEIRAYLINTGGHRSRPTINTTTGYIITRDASSIHLHGNNTASATVLRQDGVAVVDHLTYVIEPDSGSYALKSAITNKDAGLIHTGTTVYTIEVP